MRKTSQELIEEIKKLRDAIQQDRNERQAERLAGELRKYPDTAAHNRRSPFLSHDRILNIGFPIQVRALSYPEIEEAIESEIKTKKARVLDEEDLSSIKIVMRATDALRLKYFASAVALEVSCKAIVVRRGDYVHIDEILFFQQKDSASETDIDPEDEAKFLDELINSDLTGEEIDRKIMGMRCWIHSHRMLSLFWSPKDKKTIEGFANKDFFISIVIASLHHIVYYRCRLDLFPPEEKIAQELETMEVYRPSRLVCDDLPIYVVDDRGPDFDEKKLKEEVEKIAKEKIGVMKISEERRFTDMDDGYYEPDENYLRLRTRGTVRLHSRLLPPVFRQEREGD